MKITAIDTFVVAAGWRPWSYVAVRTDGGITGYGGGKLLQICRDSLHIPLDDMGMVESIHLLLFHWILNDVHARVNGIGRHAPPETRNVA